MWLVLALGAAGMCADCSVGRTTSTPPTFDNSIGALLAQRCVACHGTSAPAGGWRAASYLEAIACVADGRAAVLPADESAPIVSVLADATHAAILAPGERDTLVAWVRAAAPKYRGTTHDPSFVDPRSGQSHGASLRSKRWSPMLDANDPESCGRCHDGAPTRPASVTSGAPSAPPCTTCHQEPGGALGCNTCHGQGAGEGAAGRPPFTRDYPPRDPCFFPAEANQGGAHAPHGEATATHAVGLPCSTCHPAPGNPIIGGTHADGIVEVVLDPAFSGASATFDATTGVCATTCHARPGGARPRPAWTETTPMKCGDCHSSPPPSHFAGACTNCHRQTNASGTGFITAPTLHINGRVDLGDGSGKCGECHGRGDDPWPSTNAHPGHENPTAAAQAPCASCHAVPTAFGPGTSHPLGVPVTVALTGLAVARGTAATFTAGSCRQVYCHGAGLEATVPATPAWADTSGAARKCGACHATPPGPPHFASPACDLCHRDGAVTAAGPAIAPEWVTLHVNGVVDR